MTPVIREEVYLIGGIYWPLRENVRLPADQRRCMITFDDVYRQHLSTVLRAASRAVGRRDVAEEITADAFLELHRQFDRIDTDRLPGWLITVVKHRAIDYWRRQQLERRFAEQAVTATPEAAVLAVARQDGLLSHPALKPVHRACLTMRYEHEMTREEIAARLGLSETQVRGHLQYGLTLLRKHVTGNA